MHIQQKTLQGPLGGLYKQQDVYTPRRLLFVAIECYPPPSIGLTAWSFPLFCVSAATDHEYYSDWVSHTRCLLLMHVRPVPE